MVAITDKFAKVGTGTVTSLASPGKEIGAASINIGSATNYPTDTAVYFAIRIVDPTLISFSPTNYNPSGVVAGTYTVWKGTVSGTVISNLQLQSGGAADQVYPAGTNTQVFIDLGSAQMNSLIDGVLVEHNQNGTHSNITATSLTTSAAVTVGSNLNVTGTLTGITPAKFSDPYKFSAYRSAPLTINTGPTNTIICDAEEFDTGSNFNVGTGLFTAPAAGFYSFSGAVTWSVAGNGQSMYTQITKNGTEFKRGNYSYNSTGGSVNISSVVTVACMQLGAGDTVSLGAAVSNNAGLLVGANTVYFTGFLISAT